MILNAEISKDDIVLLNEKAASRKAKEKPLITAWNRSDGAFLCRLALMDEPEKSKPVLHLLWELGREFLKPLAFNDVINDRYYFSSEAAALPDYEAIGEKLDDGEHSSFFYPRNLKKLAFYFFRDLQQYANRSAGSLSLFLKKRNLFPIHSQLYFFLDENPDDDQFPFLLVGLVPYMEKGKKGYQSLYQVMMKKQRRFQELGTKIGRQLNEAADRIPFIKRLITSRLIFHPVRLTDEEAFEFFSCIPQLEECGILCRLPEWMNKKKSKIVYKSQVQDSPGMFNELVLNQYQPSMTYNGVTISEEEAERLLAESEGLQMVNGKWVNADHAAIQSLLKQYRKAKESGSSLISLMNMQAKSRNDPEDELPEIEFSYEDWMKANLRLHARKEKHHELNPKLDQLMRPYQKEAFQWMSRMDDFQMGVCLADDMGLGKTLEVLSFLSEQQELGKKKVLIVVPATLIGNWAREIDKFTPWLSYRILDGKNDPEKGTTDAYINLITYQKCRSSAYPETVDWDIMILDEAQAIKNVSAGQTKKVKMIKAHTKLALTGTPIENNLMELWSIFDFINPGLLGTKDEFMEFKRQILSDEEGMQNLRNIIHPFIMRRLKTDKSIISDLPEKNEVEVRVDLSREQIVLYRKEVEKLNEKLMDADPNKKKFMILTAITKLKQICNHPSQYYKSEDYPASKSGKFQELTSIAETIAENKERVLVFTQFAQIIPALDRLLAKVFKKQGAAIDGSTPTGKRMKIVEGFQNGEYPYLVLSLKTAGVGLNLTNAQNVIHFDRWWNPAVENQATDRAYRIGQDKDVTVFKMVTNDTIEEVVSQMLVKKQDLADQLINDLDSQALSTLSVDELISAIQWRGSV